MTINLGPEDRVGVCVMKFEKQMIFDCGGR